MELARRRVGPYNKPWVSGLELEVLSERAGDFRVLSTTTGLTDWDWLLIGYVRTPPRRTTRFRGSAQEIRKCQWVAQRRGCPPNRKCGGDRDGFLCHLFYLFIDTLQ